MLKDMKLGVKMIGGFMIVALIVAIVGFIGLFGANTLSQNMNEIGQVRLPSVRSLLETEIALEELMVAQRTLLNERLDSAQRASYLEVFNKSRQHYQEIWIFFKSLPATADEERLTRRLDEQFSVWAALNNQWIEANQKFEAIGILDPSDIVEHLQQFRADHYALELEVAQLLLTGEQFEGGADASGCDFGRWMTEFRTDNPRLQQLIRDVQDPHKRFHQAVGDIRDLVRAGNRDAAQNLFTRTMLPASEQVFAAFYQIISIADEANIMRNDIIRLVLGPISTETYNAYTLLNELAEFNTSYAEEAVIAAATASNFVNMMVISGIAIGTILAIILGIILTQAITKPVAKGVKFAQKIALGEMDINLDVNQKDEIGILADAMRDMLKALSYKAGILEKIANGDLTVNVQMASDNDGLGKSMTTMVEALNDTLGQINTAVEQVAEGSVQVSQASQSLSQGATEQASSLEEITSSTAEISSQTKQNTDNALKMNGLASDARENAEKGNLQMQDLVSAMNEINASAEEIKKVVKTIDDISFQINLLALNANVEAARAGKYGKGFAVVAEEVRNLAVRSAAAVKDTTTMVEESINNTRKGNLLVESTASQLNGIVTGSSQVASLAEEVATAGKEQTQGLEQISLGLSQIDQVTQSNTASAEESASASEELSSQAQQVKAMLARFKLKQTENRMTNTEMMELLKAELASRGIHSDDISTGAHNTVAQQATIASKKPAPKAGKANLKPSDIISLDDSNFGKF